MIEAALRDLIAYITNAQLALDVVMTQACSTLQRFRANLDEEIPGPVGVPVQPGDIVSVTSDKVTVLPASTLATPEAGGYGGFQQAAHDEFAGIKDIPVEPLSTPEMFTSGHTATIRYE